MSDATVDDGWLRDRAAIVGIGHTPWGKRGEYADKGHLRLVVEAITNACEDAGISAKDIDGYSSYSTLDRARRAVRRVRRRRGSATAAQTWGGGGALDGRRVPERGDGRRHRSGRTTSWCTRS